MGVGGASHVSPRNKAKCLFVVLKEGALFFSLLHQERDTEKERERERERERFGSEKQAERKMQA